MSDTKMSLGSILKYAWPILLILFLLALRYVSEEQPSAGAKIYTLHCANCHMEEGQGLKQLIPGLANSAYLQNHGADIACLIRYGSSKSDSTQVYLSQMPGNESLRPVEIAILISYIQSNWGNSGEEVSAREVEDALEVCRPSS